MNGYRTAYKFMAGNAARVRPNPSLEPTRYGRQWLAAPRHGGHHRYAASHCLPPRAAQLER